jgi:hypothetical protein
MIHRVMSADLPLGKHDVKKRLIKSAISRASSGSIDPDLIKFYKAFQT